MQQVFHLITPQKIKEMKPLKKSLYDFPEEVRLTIWKFFDSPILESLLIVNKLVYEDILLVSKKLCEERLHFSQLELGYFPLQLLIKFDSESQDDLMDVLLFAASRDNLWLVKKLVKRLAVISCQVHMKSPGLAPINFRKEIKSNGELKASVYRIIINFEKPVSPLYVTCLRGAENVLQFFLQFKPNLNQIDKKQNTSLFHAALKSHRGGIARRLLEIGADCTTLDRHGKSPLMCACYTNQTDIAELIIPRLTSTNSLENQKALAIAAKRGQYLIVKLLLAKGVKANNEALDAAIEGSQEEIMNLLISNGANVNFYSRGQLSSTPLMTAIKKNNRQLAIILLQHGANPKIPRILRSAYSQALERNSYEWVSLFTEFSPVNISEAERLLEKYRNIDGRIKRLFRVAPTEELSKNILKKNKGISTLKISKIKEIKERPISAVHKSYHISQQFRKNSGVIIPQTEKKYFTVFGQKKLSIGRFVPQKKLKLVIAATQVEKNVFAQSALAFPSKSNTISCNSTQQEYYKLIPNKPTVKPTLIPSFKQCKNEVSNFMNKEQATESVQEAHNSEKIFENTKELQKNLIAKEFNTIICKTLLDPSINAQKTLKNSSPHTERPLTAGCSRSNLLTKSKTVFSRLKIKKTEENSQDLGGKLNLSSSDSEVNEPMLEPKMLEDWKVIKNNNKPQDKEKRPKTAQFPRQNASKSKPASQFYEEKNRYFCQKKLVGTPVSTQTNIWLTRPRQLLNQTSTPNSIKLKEKCFISIPTQSSPINSKHGSIPSKQTPLAFRLASQHLQTCRSAQQFNSGIELAMLLHSINKRQKGVVLGIRKSSYFS